MIMVTKKYLVSISLAATMALTLTPLLAGCFNPIQAALEQGVEGVTEDALGGDVDLNLDGNGASMPEGWPSVVPVIDGTIESSIRLGSGDTQTWSVTITVNDTNEAWSTIKSDFEGAGFITDFESVSSDGAMGSFSDGMYSAIVDITDNGSGGLAATYIVSLVTTQ
jgi:hypothetical protein